MERNNKDQIQLNLLISKKSYQQKQENNKQHYSKYVKELAKCPNKNVFSPKIPTKKLILSTVKQEKVYKKEIKRQLDGLNLSIKLN